jgi:enolase
MIKDIQLVKIYNSRGEETFKAKISTDHGIFEGSCGTGKSRGKFEASRLPTKVAFEKFLKVKKTLLGLDEHDWEIFDGAIKKHMLGSNITTPLSIACIRAATNNDAYKLLKSSDYNFPYPVANVIGGGAHGGATSIQEFLVIPRAKTFPDAVSMVVDVWKEIQKKMKKLGIIAGKNDEGAWLARQDEIKSLNMLSEIADTNGCVIGLDFAATQIYKHGRYIYPALGKKYSAEEQLDFVIHLAKVYNIKYIEDPFHENAFEHFSELRKRLNALIVGDDLYCSQVKRLELGIAKGSTNGIILKPDQAGTISDICAAAELAKQNTIARIVSHRSGETCDAFISDLALTLGAELIKCGVGSGERIAKLNRLIELWETLESRRMSKVNFF